MSLWVVAIMGVAVALVVGLMRNRDMETGELEWGKFLGGLIFVPVVGVLIAHWRRKRR